MSTTFYPKIDGTTTAVADLMSNLTERGHTVQLLTRRFAKTPKEELWKGLRVSRVGPTNKSSLSRIILFINQILLGAIIVRRFKVELIHCNSFISLWASLFLGRVFRIPAVMTFNGSQRIWRPEARWESETALAIALPFEILAMKFSDAVFVQSEQLKQELQRIYRVEPSKVKVVPHPVDLDLFKPSLNDNAQQSNIVLYVGTLGRIHGADLFVGIIDYVLKEFPNAKFILVGSGPLRESLKKVLIQKRVLSSVEFLGSISDRKELASLYQKSSLVVIPVRYPSHILTKLATEAMACSKPIVTTMDLEKSLSAYGIFMTRTSPREIANTIIEVLKMNNQHRVAPLSAREYVERNCSKDAVTHQIERVYSGLIEVKDSQCSLVV